MKNDFPFSRDLVLVGGGHTHALLLRKWGMKPLPGARVTLINPGPTAPYSGMLPGFIAGHYSREDLDIDLVKLARFANARLIVGRATHIDPATKSVSVEGYPDIHFDVASIDIGITSEMPDLKGFAAHGVPAKPLGAFASKWETFLAGDDPAEVAVLGGGVAGAELAMAMSFALTSKGRNPDVKLIDRSSILSGFNKTARIKLIKSLARNNVTLVENAQVDLITEDAVHLSDSRVIASQFTCGAAGALAHEWLGQSGLACTEGFLDVTPTLQTSDPDIFAVGDCANMTASPRPKAGVFAVRQAPVLFENLQAALSGGKMRPYEPQRDYLKLISLGRKSALAEKLGTAVAGAALWQWKNAIDVKFMEKFRNLPKMKEPEIPQPHALGMREAIGPKPMCGGCGAKVGRGALKNALATLPSPERDDIQTLPGDDAAVLQTGGMRQVMTTDHIRAFNNDPVVMTRVAAVHALGDIWAMGAEPQAVTLSVVLPRMSADLQQRTMSEILAAAQEIVGPAGAAIVGGHSSLGDEFTVGFALTGLCDAAPVLLGGAQEGDVLILTKPVGSGVLMAAEMQGEARGNDVLEALRLMQQPQGLASRVLAPFAHAMTDVTGFGLAGHLGGICEASRVSAEIDLAALPVMNGALDLSQSGVRSSLFDDNRTGAGPVFGADGALADLLFDPQTAGGLLAAVRADVATELQRKLWLCGYPAAIIGRITSGDALIKVV